MTGKMPPVPPANRSPKGAGEGDHDRTVREGSPRDRDAPDTAGRQAKPKPDTPRQGNRKDR